MDLLKIYKNYTTNIILLSYIMNLPKDFDWLQYINLNTDLQKVGINTKQKAIKHYLLYGIKENMIYKKNRY
jgi:hypothetical protein